MLHRLIQLLLLGGGCLSKKDVIPLKLPPCVLVIFIDINTYILTERRNLKISLKEIMYLLWTVINYLLKKCLWSLHASEIPELYRRIDKFALVVGGQIN